MTDEPKMSSMDAVTPAPAAGVSLKLAWDYLAVEFKKIFAGQHVSKSLYMELYTIITNYCQTVPYPSGENTYQLAPKVLELLSTSNLKDKLECERDSRSKCHPDLYLRIKEFLYLYVYDLLNEIQDPVATRGRGELVQTYIQCWEQYRIGTKIINGVCSTLNRNINPYWRDAGENCPNSVGQLARIAWETVVLSRLGPELTDHIIDLIRQERAGVINSSPSTINKQLVITFVKSFYDLSYKPPEILSRLCSADDQLLETYMKYFHIKFIEEAKNFYSNQSVDFFEEKNSSVFDYLELIKRRLEEEEGRCLELSLHERTHVEIKWIVEQVRALRLKERGRTIPLTSNSMDKILQEFDRLLLADKKQQLTVLYQFLARQGEAATILTAMKEHFEKHVCTYAFNMLEQLAGKRVNPITYVHTLVEICNKYRENVKSFHHYKQVGNDGAGSAGDGDPHFLKYLNKACSQFVNDNPVTLNDLQNSAKILAKYCDISFRRNSTAVSRKNGQELLASTEDKVHDIVSEQVMLLLEHLKERDLFLESYLNLLIDRLVRSSFFVSGRVQPEESDLSLRLHDFYEESKHSLKLVRLCEDNKNSMALTDEFKTYLSNSLSESLAVPTSSLEFGVKIFSDWCWPFRIQCPDFVLPIELSAYTQHFTSFYREKCHRDRKLVWLPNQSKCEVTTNCFQRQYKFQVSTFQVAILLLFNKSDSYCLSELVQCTKLDLSTVIQIVKALQKAKLLLCSDQKDLTMETVAHLNKGFSAKKICIDLKLPLEAQLGRENKLAVKPQFLKK